MGNLLVASHQGLVNVCKCPHFFTSANYGDHLRYFFDFQKPQILGQLYKPVGKTWLHGSIVTLMAILMIS
jgi:hypothetical protein